MSGIEVAEALRHHAGHMDENLKKIYTRLDTSVNPVMMEAPKNTFCVVGGLVWKVWAFIHNGGSRGKVLYGTGLWIDKPSIVGRKYECRRYIRKERRLRKVK